MVITRPITTARINPNIVFLRVVRFDNNFFIEQPRQTRILERFSKKKQKYQQQGVDNIFRSNLRDSLRFAFLAFIMSVIMQELRFHQECVRILSITTSWSQIGFYIWIFIVGVFLGTSYRTIRLLLQLLF